VITGVDSKRATLKSGNYQGNIVEPINRKQDTKAVGRFDEDEQMDFILDSQPDRPPPKGDILGAIDKVRSSNFVY